MVIGREPYDAKGTHCLKAMGIYILASGTIFKNSAFVADFFFLNKYLFSPILNISKIAIYYS